MRPAEFTPESIIEAGQALQAAGRNITGFALRQRVGGGNPSRLKQVWDEHISAQAVAKAEPVAELPIEVAEEVAAVTKALTERLAALAVELNDKAVKAAERRVAEVIRTAGEQREQAERELADASQTVDDLESKLDDAQGAALALEKRLADMQAAQQAAAVELAQVRERLALTEQAAKSAEVQHAQALKTAAQEAHRVAEKLAKAQGDRDQARTDAAATREELAKIRGQLEASEAYKAELLGMLNKGTQAQTKTVPATKKGA